jgi:hypothetical protein
MLGCLVFSQLASLITIYVINIDWIYYGLAGWDVVVSISLYSALAYFMAKLAPVYHIVNMHRELSTVKFIISVFGLTFIFGSVLNCMKGYFLNEYINVMVKQPLIFCIFSLLSSILIELCPVIIIYNMHKMFFTPVINQDL